jgi:hypothetical protein
MISKKSRLPDGSPLVTATECTDRDAACCNGEVDTDISSTSVSGFQTCFNSLLNMGRTGLSEPVFDNVEHQSKIEFRPSDRCGGSLGCFAGAVISKGDLLFRVPKSCIFSIRNAETSLLSNILREGVKELGLQSQCVTSEVCNYESNFGKEGIENQLFFIP